MQFLILLFYVSYFLRKGIMISTKSTYIVTVIPGESIVLWVSKPNLSVLPFWKEVTGFMKVYWYPRFMIHDQKNPEKLDLWKKKIISNITKAWYYL